MTSEIKRLHDEAMKLMPSGAEHDADGCPICTDTAAINPDGGQQESSDSEGANQEGSMSTKDETLSQETHEALLGKAVQDATAALQQQNEELASQAEALSSELAEAQSKVTSLEDEVSRLNTEMDSAQVELTTVKDENAQLKTEIEQRDEAARLAEIASERAKQVRNLNLFAEDKIDEASARWAGLSDEDWAERLDEWKTIQTATGETTSSPQEQASALTGSSEGEEDETASEKSVPARRKILGLS